MFKTDPFWSEALSDEPICQMSRCDPKTDGKRVIIIEQGRIIADAQVTQLKELTAQKSLEEVFQKLTDASELNAVAREFSSLVASQT